MSLNNNIVIVVGDDYILNIHKNIRENSQLDPTKTSSDPLLEMPYRFTFIGAPNLRKQSLESYYKVSLGDQK